MLVLYESSSDSGRIARALAAATVRTARERPLGKNANVVTGSEQWLRRRRFETLFAILS
jgi:hypothetical protein